MAFSDPILVLVLYLLLAILISFLLFRHHAKPKPSTPPGPRPLPVIGNLHQLGPIAHRSFYDLSKVYGPLFQLNLGRVPALVVSSPSLAEQVLKTHDLAFCSRPPLTSFKEYSFNGCHIAAAAYGDQWRELRKIFILELLSSKKLRTFISAREEETQKMIHSIKTRPADTNLGVNVSEYMIRLTNSLICRVALGYQDEGDYGERSRFQGILEETNAMLAGFFAADYFPGFGWIDTLTGRTRRLKRNSKKLDDFYQEVIDKKLEDEEEGSSKDIVDVLLRLWWRQGENLSMDHIKGAVMVCGA